MSKVIGEKLKEYIKTSGLSEAEWAKIHNFPQTSVNSWTSGTRNCLLKNAKKIAAACGCRLSEISTYPDHYAPEDMDDRIAFVSNLDSYEFSELVNAYTDGRLDLSQLAKLDDLEDFRDRAIAAVGRMDIPVDIKGKVIDMLSKLEQMKVDK